MRIGLIGGSFNPIHSGHLGIAGKAVTDWRLDLLLFIPAKVNPFKVGASGTDVAGGLTDAVRWDLVVRVCALNPKFQAWDIDLKRPDGPSYAIDTVRVAQRLYPGAELFWLIGADNIADLPRWKDWETLKTLVTFIDFPRTPESSTEIRRRLVAGESIADLVPPCVVEGLKLEQTSSAAAQRRGDL